MSTTDQPDYQPAMSNIRETFEDEITSLGGSVADVFDDGQRLFARAVLDSQTEVRLGDAIKAGVAIRASGPEIFVHPYTVRQVCINGAIAAHALESRRIERPESTGVFVSSYDVAMTLHVLRNAIRECATKEAFETAAEEMRSALEVQAEMALHLLPLLARAPHMAEHLIPQIFARFAETDDRSVFALMNAVTSVARDTRDPEARWSLESVGGSIPARLRAPASVRADVARALR